jgi:hypothetical protein
MEMLKQFISLSFFSTAIPIQSMKAMPKWEQWELYDDIGDDNHGCYAGCLFPWSEVEC